MQLPALPALEREVGRRTRSEVRSVFWLYLATQRGHLATSSLGLQVWRAIGWNAVQLENLRCGLVRRLLLKHHNLQRTHVQARVSWRYSRVLGPFRCDLKVQNAAV